eukprot:5659398-Pyramimonas_sp.AAC.1
MGLSWSTAHAQVPPQSSAAAARASPQARWPPLQQETAIALGGAGGLAMARAPPGGARRALCFFRQHPRAVLPQLVSH